MAARAKQVLESFIKIYKEETCLWKLKSKQYHNRPKREAAYERLINKLKEIDPTANKDAVTKKINNLRSSYRKELKKVNTSLNWGNKYQPKLWYFDLLTFLDDQDIQRPSCSNESDYEPRVIVSQGVWGDDEGSQLSATNDFDSLTSSNPAIYESAHITPLIRSIKPQDDKMDFFAKHIAMTLREMSKEQRILAEKLIGDILFEAQMGTLTISNLEQKKIQPSLTQFFKKHEYEEAVHPMNSNEIDFSLQKDNHKISMKRKRGNAEDTDDEDSHDYSHDSASDEVEVNLGLVKEEDVSDEDDMEPMGDESLCVEMTPQTTDDKGNTSYVPINAEVLKKAITTVNRLTDDCCIFGDFVASELRSLKSTKLRLKLQSRIQKAILKIAEEDEDLQDSQKEKIPG